MKNTITPVDNHRVYQRILEMNPDYMENIEYMTSTAGIHQTMATSYRDLELFEKSFHHIQISIEILEKLLRNNSDNISLMTSLATAFNETANLLMTTGDFIKAQQYYARAMEIQKRLMELSAKSLKKAA